MAKITRKEISDAIDEIVQFVTDRDIDPNAFINQKGRLKPYNQVIYEKKVKEVIDKLTKGAFKEYIIETIVFDRILTKTYHESKLLNEWKQYKNIPQTNLTYRYDSGNTNTKTIDHIHVYANNNQLYAINKDGRPHDGSTAKLGSKEIKFLKSIGFTPPSNGILEWITLDNSKTYQAVNRELLIN